MTSPSRKLRITICNENLNQKRELGNRLDRTKDGYKISITHQAPNQLNFSDFWNILTGYTL